jgi:hypothetical protein
VVIFEAASYQIDLAPDAYGMGLPIFGTMASWWYFLYVAVLCLLPNAAYEVWCKLYNPLVYQTLQHIPPEVIAAREAAERQQVRDAELAAIEAAKQASIAVAASKGKRRTARIFKDTSSLSPQLSARPLADEQHFRFRAMEYMEPLEEIAAADPLAAAVVTAAVDSSPAVQPASFAQQQVQSQGRAALHVDENADSKPQRETDL